MKDSMLQLCLSSNIIEKDLRFSNMTDDRDENVEVRVYAILRGCQIFPPVAGVSLIVDEMPLSLDDVCFIKGMT
jgi:hypothetical protein